MRTRASAARPAMAERAFQIDLGRQIERPEVVSRWIPVHRDWGYTAVVLYLEDGFRFPSHPGFARPRAWALRALERVARTARRCGMGVIPVVPSLGHASYFLRHPDHRRLDEARGERGAGGLPVLSGQVCPSLGETYEFLDDLFGDVAPFCTAGYLHVGLDESLDIGRCPLCRPRLAAEGPGGIFTAHLKRLHELVAARGLRTAVWGDMLYYFPDAIREIPRGTAVFDWYYYPFRRFPRVELHNFAEIDSAGRLAREGIETWACPNNGPFMAEPYPPVGDRLENIVSWWRYGLRTGCRGLVVTSWSPSHAPLELNFLVNAAAADLWLAGGAPDTARMISSGLSRMFGPGADAWLPAVRELQRRQLSGYWRWQVYRSPLSKLATLGPVRDIEEECAALRRLEEETSAGGAPAILTQTAAVRRCFAAKELLARGGARAVLAARRAARDGNRAGLAAARDRLSALLAEAVERNRAATGAADALWARTRYRSDHGRVARILAEDRAVFERIERFLRETEADPHLFFRPSDLLGARQLLVTVRNRRPCLQGLEVLLRTDGRGFVPVHSLYLLEFTADAGRPLANFMRIHSIPLPAEERARPAAVKFLRRGVGQIEISRPWILDGTARRRAARVLGCEGTVSGADRLLLNGWTVIGAPAPRSGFPLSFDAPVEHSITVEFPAA